MATHAHNLFVIMPLRFSIADNVQQCAGWIFRSGRLGTVYYQRYKAIWTVAIISAAHAFY